MVIQMQNKKSIIKWVVLGVFVVICICMCVFFSITQTSMQNDIDSKQSELKAIQSKITMAQATTQTNSEKVVADATGIDQSMVEKDNAAAQQLFKLAFTWDSYEKYTQVRQNVISQYGFSEDSEFMTKILPEVKQFTLETYNGPNVELSDAEREKYMKTVTTDDITDNGLNMSYSTMNSCVSNVTTDGYEYLTRVTVSSTSKVGATVTRAFTLGYVVDSNEKLQDIKVYSVGLSSDQ